jgi:hypothetical protein
MKYIHPNQPSLNLMPRSRIAAKAEGLPLYFTGIPCIRGHVAPRFTSNFGCKVCAAAKTARYRAENPEKSRVSNLRSYHKHRKRRLKDMKEDYLAKREERIARAAKWQKDHPDRVNERQRRLRAADPHRYREKERKKRKENIDKIRMWGRQWRDKNRAICAANTRRQKYQRLKAAPPWLTKEQRKEIAAFYREAQRLTRETGVIHHVDHIHPIRGKHSWGLHVPWNLQVLPWHENLTKNNKLLEHSIDHSGRSSRDSRV